MWMMLFFLVMGLDFGRSTKNIGINFCDFELLLGVNGFLTTQFPFQHSGISFRSNMSESTNWKPVVDKFAV